MAGNDSILKIQKEEFYSSPESFKEFAFSWIDNASSFHAMFCGNIESKKYGETTLRFDDQSLSKIAEAYANLRKAVEVANVYKVPRLRLVK